MISSRLICALTTGLLLVGCEDEEDRAFKAKCRADTSYTSAQCSCINDVINDNLSEPGRSYVKALILGDQAEANRLYARIGMLERAYMSGHAGAAVRRASTACNVQFS